VEDDAADELDVEMTHMEASRNYGERFGEEVVEGGALVEAFLELDGLSGEADIGEGLELRFEVVDGGEDRPHGLHLALVFGAGRLWRGRRRC
jgi:hypothetical protein